MGIECCSVVILCFGAFASMSAIAMVAIGTTTDHWTLTVVDRTRVAEYGELNNTGYMYHTRHTGLFRICFPEADRPEEDTKGLYLSLLEDWCYSRDYDIDGLLSGELAPVNMSSPASTHLQLLRVTPTLLFAYLFSMLVVGILGLCGCWQQSANKLIITAAFQLLSALVGACAMATWHAATFYEMEKVHDKGFPLSWPVWLQESSTVETSWSYILCWSGICITLLSSLLTSGSAICLRSYKRKFEDNSLRMKLKMSRMFAQHAYFPDSTGSPTPRGDYPTIPANYSTKNVIDSYEHREPSPLLMNGSQQPFFNGSDRRYPKGFIKGQRHMPPGVQSRYSHSRESSDLSESYKPEDYRRVINELQDSKF